MCSRHCSTSEHPTVRGHCHRHPGLKSHTRNVYHSGPCQNKGSWKDDRLGTVSKPHPWTHIQIHPSNEADKEAHSFAVSVALAYRLSTRRTTVLARKYKLPILDRLLKYKRKLRKLWQDTGDPACKTAVNWNTQNIGKIVQKRALEIWETKLAKCEITPHLVWPIAKSPPPQKKKNMWTKGTIFYS